jgi:hypothetical protein
MCIKNYGTRMPSTGPKLIEDRDSPLTTRFCERASHIMIDANNTSQHSIDRFPNQCSSYRERQF